MGCQKLHINTFYPTLKVVKGDLYGQLESGVGSYRYGFNGMEADDEVKGGGNSINYIERMYDPRLGRFLSIDPLFNSFPWYTPYQYAGNKPIIAIDLDGAEEYIVIILRQNGKAIGWGIMYNPTPVTSCDVALRAAEKALETHKKDVISLNKAYNAKQMSQKDYLANQEILAAEGIVAQNNVDTEKEKYEEANKQLNKNKAVYLYIETNAINDVNAFKSFMNNYMSHTATKPGDEIVALDEETLIWISQVNYDDNLTKFQNYKAVGYHVYPNTPVNSKIILSADALFDVGQYQLNSEKNTDLDKLAWGLKYNPSSQIEIFGYTDPDGKPDPNLILSQNRANTIKTYLLSHGVQANQIIECKGKGATDFIYTDGGIVDKQKSRRVEIIVIK